MPYAKTTDTPNVGDRVRHASGRVGTVIFVQRDAATSQAREQIRVRWDPIDSVNERLAESAPHFANEYILLPAKELRDRGATPALRSET